jgi:hypothetical protein
VDPDNRLVADVLEADWNAKLRLLVEAQEDAERQRQAAHVATEQERAAVLALATDFPRLWADPRTADRDRKRMVRLLLADVTLLKGTQITIQVRFVGGATQTLQVAPPRVITIVRRTDAAIVAEIDRLLDQYTDAEIAAHLNAQGRHSYDGKPFHRLLVAGIRKRHHLLDRFTRLRARGLLTLREMSARLHVCTDTVEHWRDRGLLHAERYSDRGDWLYAVPDRPLPPKWKHKRRYAQLVPETCQGGAV